MSALAAVIDDKIWTVDRLVWFGGVRLRARTTVVRLEDGSVLLHSPAPPSDALAERAQFGERCSEFEALPLEGVPFLDETVLHHLPTQTLLGADAFFSPAPES